MDSLSALLRDSHYSVRHAACVALGKVGAHTPTVVPALVKVRSMERGMSAHTIRSALHEGGGRCVRHTQVLKDGSVNRSAAAASLATGGRLGVRIPFPLGTCSLHFPTYLSCCVLQVEALCAIVREAAKESAPVRIAAVYGLSVIDPAAETADTAVDTLFEASQYVTSVLRAVGGR